MTDTATTSQTAFAGFAIVREGETIATLSPVVSKASAERLAEETDGEWFACYSF